MKLFTIIAHDSTLLPAFLDYYSTVLGVTEFYIVVGAKNKNQDILSKKYNICWVINKKEASSPIKTSSHHITTELRKQYCGPDEWHFAVDLDEFIVPFGMNFCKRYSPVIYGVMIDRITKDGKIIKSNATTYKELWEEFPVRSTLSRDFLNSNNKKGVLLKGYVTPWAMTPGKTPTAIVYSECYHKFPDDDGNELVGFQIEHFKWRNNIIKQLSERFKIQKKNKLKWWIEHNKAVSYYRRYKHLPLEYNL